METVQREWQLWQCNYFQQEKEMKHNEGWPSVKNVSTHSVIKKQVCAELWLDKDLKDLAWLPVKVIKLWSSYELTRLSVAGNDPR